MASEFSKKKGIFHYFMNANQMKNEHRMGEVFKVFSCICWLGVDKCWFVI